MAANDRSINPPGFWDRVKQFFLGTQKPVYFADDINQFDASNINDAVVLVPVPNHYGTYRINYALYNIKEQKTEASPCFQGGSFTVSNMEKLRQKNDDGSVKKAGNEELLKYILNTAKVPRSGFSLSVPGGLQTVFRFLTFHLCDDKAPEKLTSSPRKTGGRP